MVSTYVRASTDLDTSSPLQPARVLINSLGNVLLPESPRHDTSSKAHAAFERRDSDGALEEVGARATGADYDPLAFSALRQRQILAHRRNGSIHDRFSVNVWAVTWNVAGLTPTPASVLDALGQPAPGALPDLVLFGVQEAVDLNAREVLLTDGQILSTWKGLLEGALSAWLLEMRSSDEPCADGIRARLSSQPSVSAHLSSERCPYVLVESVQLVGILLLLWARRDHASHCAEVRTATVGTGALGFLGNKGAAAIRLRFYHSTFAVVCAHLNANKLSAETRNAEYRQIRERLAFTVPREVAKAQAVSAQAVDEAPRGAPLVSLKLRHHDVTIWMGDLNYRLSHGAAFKEAQVRELIKEGKYEPLLSCCQLHEARRGGRAFEGYQEAPIAFAPTYKYDLNSEAYDSSDKKRTPAWTDRVLWTEQTREGELQRVSAVEYTRREVNVSDHRPVFCSMRVAIEAESLEKKARLHKALDQWEESRIPAVTLHPRELRFERPPLPAGPALPKAGARAAGDAPGDALAEPSAASRSLVVEVSNVGQTVAHFSFRKRPPLDSPFPDWLTVTPSEGEIKPGQCATLTVHVSACLPREGADRTRLPRSPVRTHAAAPAPAAASRAGAKVKTGAGGGGGGGSQTRFSALLADPAEEMPPRRVKSAASSSSPQGGGVRSASAEDVLVLTLANGPDYFLPVSAAFAPDDRERFSC